MMRNQGLDLTR